MFSFEPQNRRIIKISTVIVQNSHCSAVTAASHTIECFKFTLISNCPVFTTFDFGIMETTP